ncbi:MAG: GxxExxY protein [Bacteroidales bacterium]|nr:GxxExxY protein [Bacteroidales bacterium]
MLTQRYLNELTHTIIGAAIEVHKDLGPGLLESVYEKCMRHLLLHKGMGIITQQRVPIVFRGLYLESDLRLDMLIEDCIILEIKAVEFLLPIHEAQLLTYLKLCEKPKGILINFNCMNIFREGQKTLVTDLYAHLLKGY